MLKINSLLCASCKNKIVGAYKDSKNLNNAANKVYEFCPNCKKVCMQYQKELKEINNAVDDISNK